MKNIVLTLFLTLIFIVSHATEKEIVAKVVFENSTSKPLTSGELTIINLNQKIEVNTTESFKITLPSKGNYQFSFVSKDFTAFIFYPSKINKRKNKITIKLYEKVDSSRGKSYVNPMHLKTDLTDKEIEQSIENGTLNFIINSIDSKIPEDYVAFKEKYGIGLLKLNCVIDPISFKKTRANNKMIFNYLNKKYGSSWLNELSLKPFGIK